MKNLKKITALVIVLALCLSAVSFAAFTDVKEDANYAEAVEVMSSLGLLVGYEDGTFGPDKTITRAEFATVIVRAIAMENSAKGVQANTGFDDVKAEDWCSGYIQTAKQANIIAGYDAKTFGPNDEVTYEQAIKMIVCALGYGPKFQNNPDAYPSAYISQANSDGITTGVNVKGGSPATRADVAKMVYNALTVDLMEQVTFGGKPEWAPVDKTLLSHKLKIAKLEGTVDSIKFAKEDVGKIKFSATKLDDHFTDISSYDSILVADGIDAAAVKGYSCVAYVDTNDDDDVIKALAAKSGRNKTLVVSKDQAKDGVLDTTDNTLTYYKTNSDVDSDSIKIKLSVASTTANTANFAAYENLSTDDSTTAEFKTLYEANNFQDVKFIDNNNDGKYDVAFTNVYASFIVDEINTKSYKLTPYASSENGYDKILSLNPDKDNESYDIVDKDGKAMKFEDIKVGDVINMVVSEDGSDKYTKITVTNETIEGAISEKNSKGEFKIGDSFKKVSAGLANTLYTGDKGTFTVDMFGTVLKYTPTAVGGNFALGYAIYLDNNGIDNDPKIMLYHNDGKFVTHNFATNVKINSQSSVKAKEELVEAAHVDNGVNVPADIKAIYKKGQSDSPVNEIIMYETNSNDEITALYYGSAGIQLKNSNYDVDTLSAVQYRASNKKIDSYYIKDDSKFFSNADKLHSEDKADYSMFTGSSFVEEKDYDLTVIYDKSKNIVAGYVTGNAPEADKAGKAMFVTGIGSGVDSEGSSATIITGIVNDETVKIVSTGDTRIYGAVGVVTPPASKPVEPTVLVTDITKGSVIQYVGEGEVAAIRVILTGEQIMNAKTASRPTPDPLNFALDEKDKEYGFMRSGQAYEIISGCIGYGTSAGAVKADEVDAFASVPTMIVRPDVSAPTTVGKVFANGVSLSQAETFKTQKGEELTNPNDDYIIVYKFDDVAKFAVIVDYASDTDIN